jgi:hypothetical protein
MFQKTLNLALTIALGLIAFCQMRSTLFDRSDGLSSLVEAGDKIRFTSTGHDTQGVWVKVKEVHKNHLIIESGEPAADVWIRRDAISSPYGSCQKTSKPSDLHSLGGFLRKMPPYLIAQETISSAR